MAGGKYINILSRKHSCTSRISLYGMEAITTKFVELTGERTTVWHGCVLYVVVRGLVKSLGWIIRNIRVLEHVV